LSPEKGQVLHASKPLSLWFLQKVGKEVMLLGLRLTIDLIELKHGGRKKLEKALMSMKEHYNYGKS
jgi:hypothetical protein